MRVVSLHRDVIVAVSSVWQTTCTFVRSGQEGFVIDSPLLPSELESLPALAEQAGFPISGLLSTHADWDHLLARLAFPNASLGTGEASADRLARDLGAPQRALRSFDEEHYIPGPRALGVGGVQRLPAPGRLGLGDSGHELELHPAEGHTSDGIVFVVPWARVLVCGDYLSPVEIPWISAAHGGTLASYRRTAGVLQTLLSEVETVVPGHGQPLARDDALRILEEDEAYLQALADDGAAAPLPAGRRTDFQREIHAKNVASLDG